jgi:putative tryptophan/tyrosine transport system substrate-binding protein
MRRRQFIGGVASAAVAWPAAIYAQEAGRKYRLAFLVPAPRQSSAIAAFFDELRANGFDEGQNLIVSFPGFNIANEQISEGVRAAIASNPDAIVAGPELYAGALQAATKTIPLLSMSEDLLGAGLAASLARPGGNVTGISLLSPELDDKRQGLLIEAVPHARRIATLVDAAITPAHHLDTLRTAANSRSVELAFHLITTAGEIGDALEAAKTKGAEALNVLATPLFFVNGQRIIDQAASLRLPAIFQWPEMADQGALLAYGPPFAEVYRQRARQVAKVLRGAKPSEIPVEQPVKFELVINLKTAKTIGCEVPAAMVLRADRLVE